MGFNAMNEHSPLPRLRTGWDSVLARLSLATLLFETMTGLAITLSPFHPVVTRGLQ